MVHVLAIVPTSRFMVDHYQLKLPGNTLYEWLRNLYAMFVIRGD